MKDSEDIKTPELTDEELDAVAGGKPIIIHNRPAAGVLHSSKITTLEKPSTLSESEVMELLESDKAGEQEKLRRTRTVL